MTSGSPTPDINSDAADTLFSRMGAATDQPENTTQSAEMGHEQSDTQRVPKQTESMMHRTVGMVKKLFGIGAPQRRPNHRRHLGGVQSLEARMVMTGDTDMLTPADISWSEGRNDAAHVLGQANILPGANLYDVSLSPDGSKAIVAGQYSKASIVNAKTGAVITPLQGHEGSVISAAWMPDGSSFFTASYDRCVRQYAADGSLLWDSGSVGQLAVGVDVSADGNMLFVRRHEMEPLAFDIATKASRVLSATSMVADIDALADGKVLVLENDAARYRGAGNQVNIVNTQTGATEWTGSLSGMEATTAVATPNGAYVFSGTDDGSIIMHNRALGTVVTVVGLGSYVRDLAMDETGTFLIAATNSSVNVFDVEPLFAGTGSAVHTSFAMGSSSVTVSGSVALINNTSLGANSRTLAIDLSGVPNMQARLDALVAADNASDASSGPAPVRHIDINGPYVLGEAVTTLETHTIDFSTLAPGVHPEEWTTNIPGLGSVTMWFQGGVKVDSHGIQAFNQPWAGTSWSIKLNNSPAQIVSAELDFTGTPNGGIPDGRINLAFNGDNVREGGLTKYFPFAQQLDIGSRTASEIMGAQRWGNVAVKSLLVKKEVITETRHYITPSVDDTNDNGTADELALAQEEGLKEVLAPAHATMITIGNQGALGIKITTPFDETYLKTTGYGVITTEHKGGAQDLMIFNNYLTDMMENTTGSATKIWTLYADKELTVPLTELTFVGNRGGISLLSAIPKPIQKKMIPEGIETEPVPKMHISHLSGPNALFQVSSPIAQGTIEFASVHADSILGTATVMKTAEGVMNAASITMNPANATGDYHALMKGPDGRVFERVLLHWDRDTKKLSLGAGEVLWTAPESLQPSVDAAIAGLTQNLTDMTTTDPSLKVIQQEILLTAASSMPGMSQDLDTAFFAAHPDWAPAVRGTLNASQLQQFTDTYSITRENYGRFQGMLGDLLKQASQILCQIRNGENESELRRLFAITVDSYATSLPMVPLASIGIRMPSHYEILAAAKCAGEQSAEVLYAVKNKNVIQQMNQQTFASNGLVVHKDGTYMVANDPRLQQEKYYVDANGRLSVLNPDITRTLVAGLHGAAGVETSDVVDIDGHIDLGKKAEIHINNLSLNLQPNGYKVFTFELTEDDMVNIDVPGIKNRNLSLTIQGVNLPAGGYTSNKAKDSGESISLKLKAGRYTCTLQDATNYTSIVEFNRVNEKTPFDAKINMNADTFNNANIEGRISIEGNEKVMDVSMRAAEFYTDQNNQVKRKTDYNLDPNNGGVSKLKTDKPVWVVVHGMDSSERTDIMVELVKALKNHPDMQVVTVNWEDAAKDGLPTQDAKWTPAVGKWIARQLLNLGFSPQDIELKGWSHGSYVAQAVAEEVFRSTEGQKVGSLVALDPAGNWELLSHFNDKIIDFKKYADYSLAIEGSWIAGSDELARTADTYIKLNSLNTGATQIRDNHTTPVTLMASLLDYNRVVGGKQKDFISIEQIMNPALRPEIKACSENRYSGGADFVVDVNVEERLVLKDGTYYTYPYAFPFKMHYFDTNGIEKEIDFDGTPE